MFFVSYCILYVSCAHHLSVSRSHRLTAQAVTALAGTAGTPENDDVNNDVNDGDSPDLSPTPCDRGVQTEPCKGLFPVTGQTDTDLLNNMIHAKYTISASLVWFVSRIYCSTSNCNEGNKAKDIYDIYDEDSRHMAWEASLWHQLHVKCEIADTRRLIKQNQAKRDPKQRD